MLTTSIVYLATSADNRKALTKKEVWINWFRNLHIWLYYAGRCWPVLLLLLLGCWIFMGIPQGRDLILTLYDSYPLAEVNENTLTFFRNLLWLTFFLLWPSLLLWFYGRLHVYLDDMALPGEGGGDLSYRKVAKQLPRILGGLPYLLLGIFFLQSAWNYSLIGDVHDRLVPWLIYFFTFDIALFFIPRILERRTQWKVPFRLFSFLTEPLILSHEERRYDPACKCERPADEMPQSFEWKWLLELSIDSTSVMDRLLKWMYLFLVIFILVVLYFAHQWLGVPTSVAVGAVGLGNAVLIACLLLSLPRRRAFMIGISSFLVFMLMNGIRTSDNNAVYLLDKKRATKKAPITLKAYTEKWIDERSKLFNQNTEIPIFLVAAEGGASRSGYWAAMVLDSLQRKHPQFAGRVFAYSSVSGGSLGVAAFNATMTQGSISDFARKQVLDKMYSKDLISKPLARFFMTEIFDELLGVILDHLPALQEGTDRARALEAGFEEAYSESASKFGVKNSNNPFSKPYLDFFDRKLYVNDSNLHQPAHLINGFSIEQGHPWVQSPITWNKNEDAVRFPSDTIQQRLKLSTAIHNGARFPYFSPAGRIFENGKTDYIVDGGYYENLGLVSLLSMMNELNKLAVNDTNLKKCKFYLIVIRNFDLQPSKPADSTQKKSQLSLPIKGIFSARSTFGNQYLTKAKAKSKSQIDSTFVFELHPEDKRTDVPMNWVLSPHARNSTKKALSDSNNIKAFEGIEHFLRKTKNPQ